MDRVRNEEVRRRAGIERDLESRADQRVLRWFGHGELALPQVKDTTPLHLWPFWPQYGQKGVDGGSKWRAGTRETEVGLDGWCEGGLGQQRNDGGGCASIGHSCAPIGHSCAAMRER